MPVTTDTVMNPVMSKRMLSAINGALADIDKAYTECDLAEQCGNSCHEKREELDMARQQLNTFKAFYFPQAK